VLNAHVTTDLALIENPDHMLFHLREIANKELGIAQVTIKLESSPEGCDENHHVSHA